MCDLEKIGLVDQDWLGCNLSGLLLLRTLVVVGRRLQFESVEVALDMEVYLVPSPSETWLGMWEGLSGGCKAGLNLRRCNHNLAVFAPVG